MNFKNATLLLQICYTIWNIISMQWRDCMHKYAISMKQRKWRSNYSHVVVLICECWILIRCISSSHFHSNKVSIYFLIRVLYTLCNVACVLQCCICCLCYNTACDVSNVACAWRVAVSQCCSVALLQCCSVALLQCCTNPNPNPNPFTFALKTTGAFSRNIGKVIFRTQVGNR